MSVVVTTPPLPVAGVLNEHVSPAGIDAGQENTRVLGSSWNPPLGVAMMFAVPLPMGAKITDPGTTEVMNGSPRARFIETARVA